MIIVGVVALVLNLLVCLSGEDTPKGNYSELIKLGLVGRKMLLLVTKRALFKAEVWMLCLIYAFTYSYDVYFATLFPSYFKSEFGIQIDTARTYGAMVGLTNIVGRSLGGFISDYFARNHYVGGRVQFAFVSAFVVGLIMVIFSQINDFNIAYAILILLSFTSNMAQAAAMSIVPYIEITALGVVCGIVTSGAMIGSVIFILLKNLLNNFQNTFMYFGLMTVGVSFTAALIKIEKQSSSFLYILFFGLLGIFSFLHIIIMYFKVTS